jgi:hypothetical protein
MQKVFYRMSLLSLVSLAMACVQIKDKNHDRPEREVMPDTYVESTATPNQFFVHLKPMAEVFEVRRQSLNEREVEATAVPLITAGSQWVDAHVTPGESYRYQYVGAAGQVLKRVEVKIPLDVVIDHEVTLTAPPEWKDIHRFYLLKGGVLTINGLNFVLKADEFYSEEGIWRTFELGKTAVAGQNGRSGGEVKIFAASAKGSLRLELRGENGGPGVAGVVRGVRNGGPGGRGGDSGSLLFEIAQQNSLNVISEISVGSGGAGGAGAPAGIISPICIGGNCGHERGTPVSAGTSGAAGISGEPGSLCFSLRGQIQECR